MPHVKGNVGFVFTNEDLKEIRDLILANKVAAPARAGALAPVDVWVPAGNTGMEPGKTSFFQALGVPTKIARGTIEITTDLKLVEAGSKVGPSEATLLNLLNISPFTYGMGISQVYDQGQSFPPSVLDIGEEQLLGTLNKVIATIATISLAIGFPTLPSVMHSVVNSYKNVLAVAVETEYSWPEIEQLKDRIANPDAYAAAAPAAGTAAAGGDAEPEKKDESESEEDEDEEGFGGLLYVLPLIAPVVLAANTFTATERCSLMSKEMMMLGRFPGLRLGLRFMDLNERIHRSFAGQLNLLQRSQNISRCHVRCRDLNDKCVKVNWFSQHKRLVQIFLFSHSPASG